MLSAGTELHGVLRHYVTSRYNLNIHHSPESQGYISDLFNTTTHFTKLNVVVYSGLLAPSLNKLQILYEYSFSDVAVAGLHS